MTVSGHIALRGVAVHNLKCVDLDIPHRKLIVLCGLSGSGKSSLALDTLYAEGQRRYIESFSAYTRQFLQRLEKPEAERIDGIPPAIAVTGRNTSRSSRSTVGTATEVADYLRLLFAKIGHVFCRSAGRRSAATRRRARPSCWPRLPRRHALHDRLRRASRRAADGSTAAAAALREEGFVRDDRRRADWSISPNATADRARPAGRRSLGGQPAGSTWSSIAWRPAAPAEQRIRDSLETAFAKGAGHVLRVRRRGRPAAQRPRHRTARLHASTAGRGGGWPSAASWPARTAASSIRCPSRGCTASTVRWGPVPQCEGFGNVIDIDMDLVVPDPNKSIRDGAIAPWNTPAYAHELEELLALADDYGLPVDVPFAQLERRGSGR